MIAAQERHVNRVGLPKPLGSHILSHLAHDSSHGSLGFNIDALLSFGLVLVPFLSSMAPSFLC